MKFRVTLVQAVAIKHFQGKQALTNSLQKQLENWECVIRSVNLKNEESKSWRHELFQKQ